MSICATIGVPVITGFDSCIHDGFVGITDLRGVDQQFLLHLLRSLEPHFRSLGQTGSQANLNSDLVRTCRVVIPESPLEQARIAEVLDDMDANLAALTSIVEKKRAVRQSIAYCLLSGRKRLPGFTAPWSRSALGELGDFSKGAGIRKTDVTDHGVPCILYGELYTSHNNWVRRLTSMIPRSVAATSRRLARGDLLFAASGETSGEIGKCVAFDLDEEAYAGGDIAILSPRGQDPIFFGYRLNESDVVEQRARLGQGDAVVHISVQNLAKIEIDFPERDEQEAISQVLVDLDADIEILEARWAKMSTVKAAAAHDLLSGSTRLS